MVDARQAGGEGRLVSEAEALRYVQEFEATVDRAAKWFSRSVWASVLLPIAFVTAAIRLHSPLLALCFLMSLMIWAVTYVILAVRQRALEQAIWAQAERRPAIPALTRAEKVKRGYSLSAWGWLSVIATLLLVIAMKIPTKALPLAWQPIHEIAVGLCATIGGVALLAILLIALVRKVRRAR